MPFTTPVGGPCGDCKRYWRYPEKYLNGYQCDAFPGDTPETWIPEEIWGGRTFHDQPYPGDNGVRFDPLTEEDGVYWREAYAEGRES